MDREGLDLVSPSAVGILRASISLGKLELLLKVRNAVVWTHSDLCSTDLPMIHPTLTWIQGCKGKDTVRIFLCWWLTTWIVCNATTYQGVWLMCIRILSSSHSRLRDTRVRQFRNWTTHKLCNHKCNQILEAGSGWNIRTKGLLALNQWRTPTWSRSLGATGLTGTKMFDENA